LHFFKPSQIHSEVHSWLHSIVHSQPAWHRLSRQSQVDSKCAPKSTSMYVLKYTPRQTLRDAPNCTRWHPHSLLDHMLASKLSRCSDAFSWAHSHIHCRLISMTHSQHTWYTQQSKLSGHSQVHSKYAPKNIKYILTSTPRHAPNNAPNCTRWYIPTLVDSMLQRNISRCSQDAPKHTRSMLRSILPVRAWTMLAIALDWTFLAYLALHSHFYSTICLHLLSCMLDPATCWVADARHQEARDVATRHWMGWVVANRHWEAWGRWHMVAVFGVQCEACSVWPMAGSLW